MKSSIREMIMDINNSEYGEVYYYIYEIDGSNPKPVTYSHLRIDENTRGGPVYAINDLRHYLDEGNQVEKTVVRESNTFNKFRKIYSIRIDDIKFVEMHLYQ